MCRWSPRRLKQKIHCNGCGQPIEWQEQENWHEVAEGKEIVLCDKCENYIVIEEGTDNSWQKWEASKRQGRYVMGIDL